MKIIESVLTVFGVLKETGKTKTSKSKVWTEIMYKFFQFFIRKKWDIQVCNCRVLSHRKDIRRFQFLLDILGRYIVFHVL